MSADRLVLVTRPAGAADALVDLLRERGYRVAAVPTVATHSAGPEGALNAALREPRGWDWIVVTSAAGARAIGAPFQRLGRSADTMAGVRWGAVGPGTASALAALGIRADFVPGAASGLGLAHELAALVGAGGGRLTGVRVLLARADAASVDLPTALIDAGAEVHDVVAYHTVEAPPESASDIAKALSDPGLAAIVVASGSAVRGLLQLAKAAGLADRVVATPVIAIGPSTSAAARAAGFSLLFEASAPTAEALATAVDAALAPALVGRLT